MAKTSGVCALRRLQEALTEKMEVHPGILSWDTYLTQTEKDPSEANASQEHHAFTHHHQEDGHVSMRTKASSKQNPRLPPFNWILTKHECANIGLNRIPPQKLKEVVSLILVATQPVPHIAEGSTSCSGQTSPL